MKRTLTKLLATLSSKLEEVLPDFIVRFWKKLDPKLKYTVLSFAAARLALEAGVPWDPTTEAVVAGVIASAVGYVVPNEVTTLRKADEENGNPDVPDELDPQRADEG